MARKTIDNVAVLKTPKAMMQAIDDNFIEVYDASVNPPLQSTGTSTTRAMSQKACTDSFAQTSGSQTISGVKTFQNEIISNSLITAGQGSGSVSLTVNDGLGQANVAFNHKYGIPDIEGGSSARITASVDDPTASMQFQLRSNTEKEISQPLITVMALKENEVAIFTPLKVPTPTAGTHAANKAYVDNALYLQPSMTGTITLNGTTDNTAVLTDIVTEIRLEVGDVIRIDTGVYNKLHTVESITNNGSIIVNYEHAGNRGNGSLKLQDFTGQATVTRIAKWFNAPLGLGQEWVSVAVPTAFKTNTTGRSIKFKCLWSNVNNVSVRYYSPSGDELDNGQISGVHSYLADIITQGLNWRFSTAINIRNYEELR